MAQPSDQCKAHLKATYGALYHRLVQILYIADIAGISHFAADEYEPEVTTILPRLPQATSAAEVEQILREEFAYWFDPDPGITTIVPERYAWAARTIWQAWCTQAASVEQSSLRQRLTALWWMVTLHGSALVTPLRKPGRVFRL